MRVVVPKGVLEQEEAVSGEVRIGGGCQEIEEEERGEVRIGGGCRRKRKL